MELEGTAHDGCGLTLRKGEAASSQQAASRNEGLRKFEAEPDLRSQKKNNEAQKKHDDDQRRHRAEQKRRRSLLTSLAALLSAAVTLAFIHIIVGFIAATLTLSG